MNTNRMRTRSASLLCAMALAASGCATATARFYTLGSTAAATGAPPLGARILVGPVSVPSAVDRPQFVVQVDPNRVEIDEFNVWAAPLGEGIARVVANDLGVLLGSKDVAIAGIANFAPDWRVTIDVQRFDSVPGSTVSIDAIWSVTPTASGKKPRAGRSSVQENVAGADYSAIAAAHSRALSKLSGDIATAIRAESGRR